MAAWLDAGEGRVRRLWRSLGLHQPRKLPRRRRSGSGSDMRLPGAVRPNSVWSYDFVHEQFVNGPYGWHAERRIQGAPPMQRLNKTDGNESKRFNPN